jgi:oxygen-independent coproporphyrinogen-3 oxidase
MSDIASTALIERYNLPVPRYTSYPTVPVWTEGLDVEKWKASLRDQFKLHNRQEGISLYIHLPFCESLCTYCGCNKKITTHHGVEGEYLTAIEREWALYLQEFSEKPLVRELHLGGGTPTFFSPENLEWLLGFIRRAADLHPERAFSIEGHPNNTTPQHLAKLYELGFRRISFGVQDNDPEVQQVINRIQPWENVERVTNQARDLGFESVNFDLIYGLPKQTLDGISNTFEQVLNLMPDRIAFYSYAHVPWTSRGQRLFHERDLPSAADKLQLYLKGKEMLTGAGYTDIGMDHFALPHDTLFQAWQDGSLHRNFMGYTTQKTTVLLGLGVSSISDTGVSFAQNRKSLHEYYESISRAELPVFKGYFLNEEDKSFRRYIGDISCRGNTRFREEDRFPLNGYSFPVLQQLEADGLITWDQNSLEVTLRGRQFIRNICSAFDLYLQRSGKAPVNPMYSKAI